MTANWSVTILLIDPRNEAMLSCTLLQSNFEKKNKKNSIMKCQRDHRQGFFLAPFKSSINLRWSCRVEFVDLNVTWFAWAVPSHSPPPPPSEWPLPVTASDRSNSAHSFLWYSSYIKRTQCNLNRSDWGNQKSTIPGPLPARLRSGWDARRASPLQMKAVCIWFWVQVANSPRPLLEIYRGVWMQIIPAQTLICRGISLEGALQERWSSCARKFGLAHWLFSRSPGKWVDAGSHGKELSSSC